MIRTVHIPRHGQRLGQSQLETSQGCIEYLDPDTGLYMSDPNTPCVAGSGGAADMQDSGLAAAVASSAADQSAAASSDILNSLGIPFPVNINTGTTALALPSAPTLFSGNALTTPVPGIGNPLASSWLIWAAVAAVILIVAADAGGGSRAPARKARQ